MKLRVVAALLVLGLFSTARADVISVDWTDPQTGDLGGIQVAFASGSSLFSADLSGTDYSAAPLSADAETSTYDVEQDWTATFAQPVTNLLLYAVYWRGTAGGASPVEYTFSQPFAILSGLGNAIVSGNTISVSDVGFHNGIIQFAGPVSSLALTTNAVGGSGQALTFGVNQAAVPEPSAAAIWSLLSVVTGFVGWRRTTGAADTENPPVP